MTDSLLYVPDAMTAPASDSWPVSELAIQTKYELDPFQKHAVIGIHAGDHVFVTAKTGSGKTFVGEYLIAHMLAQGKRVFYTTPIKSLSNQKFHDLKTLFPEATVGILTGDIKVRPDAQVVVMTAEILRNLFYKRGTATESVGLSSAVSLDGVGGIVMDEAHYIQDPDRGHVWEESLILAPRDLQLVLLSATMPSANSLAGWLAKISDRRTCLLSTTYRIVPLVHGVLPLSSSSGQREVKALLDVQGRWINDAYSGWLRDRKAIVDAAAAHKKAVDARRLGGYATAPPSGKVRVEDPVARLLRTVGWLEETKQMPALFFVFSRKDCERYAALMTGTFLDSSDTAAARHIIDFHLSRHQDVLAKSGQYHRIRDFLMRGIAFHHSGLQPLLKEIVEILFTRGYVKVLFATETFSVGLNMPTKTVVFLELEKWCDGGQKRVLRPDEYIQMAGRAGRRGLDTHGLVLYEPMKDPLSVSDVKGLLTGALAPLSSRMRFHYDFILKHKLCPTTMSIADQSYWALQQRATRTSLEGEKRILEQRIAGLCTGFSEAQQAALLELTELETEVANSVNAKRKKAQQALTRWLTENDTKELKGLSKRFAELQEARGSLSRLCYEIEAWDSSPLLNLSPLEACLTEWGFLNADPDSSLTGLGVSGTEVNEGHGILMPMLAASGILKEATAAEIACVLAAFLQEGVKDDEPTGCSSGATDPEALHWIRTQADICQKTEDRNRVLSPAGFWRLSTQWPLIVARYLEGWALPQIAAEFGLFEGNIQRGILRIANLLDEWTALATLSQNLEMVEKMGALKFLNEEIVVDSLYLRL